MRLQVIRFEPSSKAGTFQLEMPAGSQVLLARMTRMGEGNLVVAAPDVDTGAVETVTLAALWEDGVRGQTGGNPHEWRQIGCWSYDSGDFQHLFVQLPAPAAAKKAKPAPAAEPEKAPG